MARTANDAVIGRRAAAGHADGRDAHGRATADAQLAYLRGQIDAANEGILRAIERRGDLVLRIMEVKQRAGAPLIDRTREVEMLARIAALVRGPYSHADIQSIFRTIVIASRALQE